MAILDPSNATPKLAINVSFQKGPSSSGSSDYSILLIGNKLSSGTGTDATLYGPQDMSSDSDAAGLFGRGSELALMVKDCLAKNKKSTVYAMSVAEGPSSTVATGTITFTSAATSNATVTVWVGSKTVSFGVVSGDAIAVQSAACAASINAAVDLPVTASASLGVCTVTSKNKGLRSNLIKISAKASNSYGTTISPLTMTALTSGTVQDSLAAALAVIVGQRFYSIVVAQDDATNLGLLKTHIASLEDPMIGLRQRGFCGSVDTSGSATTVSIGLDDERLCLVWQSGSDCLPRELAVDVASQICLAEIGDIPTCNFNGLQLSLPVPRSKTKPTPAQIKAALNNGISPVDCDVVSGKCSLVKAITTRSTNGLGASDYRVRDLHKVFICDKLADDLAARYYDFFQGKNVADDPLPNQPPVPGAVCPRDVKAMIFSVLDTYSARGLIEQVQASKDQLVVTRPSGSNALEVTLNVDVINVLDQVSIQQNQVG